MTLHESSSNNLPSLRIFQDVHEDVVGAWHASVSNLVMQVLKHGTYPGYMNFDAVEHLIEASKKPQFEPLTAVEHATFHYAIGVTPTMDMVQEQEGIIMERLSDPELIFEQVPAQPVLLSSKRGEHPVARLSIGDGQILKTPQIVARDELIAFHDIDKKSVPKGTFSSFGEVVILGESVDESSYEIMNNLRKLLRRGLTNGHTIVFDPLYQSEIV